MQDETNKTETTTADPALGRSTVAKLPPELREAVDKAIAEGATIDEAVLGKARWPARTVTSVPVDPWNPAESLSISFNPGKSRPEKDPRASARRNAGRDGGARAGKGPAPTP